MALFRSPDIAGPGVRKDAPEKRGIFVFFELFKRHYGKLLSAGLLKAVLSLIILPSGLGAVGSARVARIAARDRHSFKSDFREAVSENLGLALISGIINSLLSAGSLFSVYYIFQENNINKNADIVSFLMLALSIFAFVIITFMRYYTPALILTFRLSIGQLYKNAFLLAFGGFKRNFVILFGHILVYALILSPMLIDIYVGFGIAVCLYILIAPPFTNLLIQYNIFPVMMKYLIEPFMKEHPGEGERTLRELGLIDSEEEQVMQDEFE